MLLMHIYIALSEQQLFRIKIIWKSTYNKYIYLLLLIEVVYASTVTRILSPCNINTLENFIDGKEFGELTEGEIKAIVCLIGLVRKILRLQPKVCTTVKAT